MADRDWEKELAEIDRRIAAAPDAPPAVEPGLGRAAVGPVAPRAVPPRAAGPVAPGVGGVPAARPPVRSRIALAARVLLALALAGAALWWPYPMRCGLELTYYLAIVGALGVVGVWTAVWAWRHRAGFAHTLALALVALAMGLAAREVLPKVGYAFPTPDHPASWSCG